MNTVTFEDAVSSLKSMFPDWDEETLSAILLSNSNHVERTIETILSMSSSESNNTNPNTNNNLSINEAISDPAEEVKQKPVKKISRDARYRGKKCELPFDFLRAPGWDRYVIADEQLARMLENELFQKQVRALLGSEFDLDNAQRRRSNSGGAPTNRTVSGSGANQNAANQDLGIMKALSSMGSAARNNLNQLAVRFSQNTSGSGGTGGGNAGLRNYGERGNAREFKPFVGDNDDEDGDAEVISFEHTYNRSGNQPRRHILDDEVMQEDQQNPLINQSETNVVDRERENMLRQSSYGGKKDK